MPNPGEIFVARNNCPLRIPIVISSLFRRISRDLTGFVEKTGINQIFTSTARIILVTGMPPVVLIYACVAWFQVKVQGIPGMHYIWVSDRSQVHFHPPCVRCNEKVRCSFRSLSQRGAFLERIVACRVKPQHPINKRANTWRESARSINALCFTLFLLRTGP